MHGTEASLAYYLLIPILTYQLQANVTFNQVFIFFMFELHKFELTIKELQLTLTI